MPSLTERVSFSVFSEKSRKETLFSSLILSKFSFNSFWLLRVLSFSSSPSAFSVSRRVVERRERFTSFLPRAFSILPPVSLRKRSTLSISLSRELWKRRKDSSLSWRMESRILEISSSGISVLLFFDSTESITTTTISNRRITAPIAAKTYSIWII